MPLVAASAISCLTTRLHLFLAVSFLVAADGLLPEVVRAETITAAALTPEAVWEAINAAKDGDVVRLPEGTAVWKRGWNAGHWAKMKEITIQVPGQAATANLKEMKRQKAGIMNQSMADPFAKASALGWTSIKKFSCVPKARRDD